MNISYLNENDATVINYALTIINYDATVINYATSENRNALTIIN